jgi:hypothetical protein
VLSKKLNTGESQGKNRNVQLLSHLSARDSDWFRVWRGVGWGHAMVNELTIAKTGGGANNYMITPKIITLYDNTSKIQSKK